jgi:hypothetical protein
LGQEFSGKVPGFRKKPKKKIRPPIFTGGPILRLGGYGDCLEGQLAVVVLGLLLRL